jgi:hypothetical protein
MKKRFTEEQIINVLNEVKAGLKSRKLAANMVFQMPLITTGKPSSTA